MSDQGNTAAWTARSAEHQANQRLKQRLKLAGVGYGLISTAALASKAAGLNTASWWVVSAPLWAPLLFAAAGGSLLMLAIVGGLLAMQVKRVGCDRASPEEIADQPHAIDRNGLGWVENDELAFLKMLLVQLGVVVVACAASGAAICFVIHALAGQPSA